MLPVITVIGIEAAFLIGGLIVTETVFNIPGVARFLVEAIRWRDYPIVQNLVMFIAVIVVVVNFLVDMLYAVLDPRIKYAGLGMSSADYEARARPGGRQRRRDAGAQLRFLARRYPLGAIGAVDHGGVRVRGAVRRLHHRHDSPLTTNAAHSLAPPSAAHWMGADIMGRDVYSRIVYGARISLAVGLGSTALGCLFGVALGLLSGYLAGWVDLLVQRLIDILQALPLLVLALVMAAALGPSLQNTIIAIAIPLIPYVARVIRSNTLALRELPFVEAARAIGMSEIAHRRAPRPAQHAGAADRAGDRAARRGDPDRGVAVVPRARRSRAATRPGAACCRNRRRNTCAPRPGW